MKTTYIKTLIIIFSILFLTACNKQLFKGADARKVSPNVDERVQKNLEEGKGITLGDAFGKGGGGTNYQFASSNPILPFSASKIS